MFLFAWVSGVDFPVPLSVDPFLCFLRFQGVMDLCISFPPLGPCHDPIVEYCAALCYVTYISLLFMYIFFREFFFSPIVSVWDQSYKVCDTSDSPQIAFKMCVVKISECNVNVPYFTCKRASPAVPQSP